MGEFRTLEGYDRLHKAQLTRSMEDYLEMICRLAENGSAVRIRALSTALHVKPSSASRMAKQMAKEGYLVFHPYESPQLTEKGKKAGAYLLWRHDVVLRFLTALNHSEDSLEETERIEHFLSEETIKNLERILPLL